jgi:hypothetical protein
MILTYRIKTNEVVAIGQAIENEALTFIELPDDPRVTQGYKMKIVDGRIEYEKPWWMDKKERDDQMKADFDNDMAKAVAAQSIDELKPLLIKMIQKNYNK